MIGKTLGEYKIIGELGKGGMGEVYLAEHKMLKTNYAIKVLPEEVKKDDIFIRRFHLEASVLAHFDHPNIVKVFNMGREDSVYYIVMEYIADKNGITRTLQDLIEKGGLSEERIKLILLQICDGLIYAHNYRDENIKDGTIHRDIKPDNILIQDQNTVKITDFGLVRLVGSEYVNSQIHQSISVSIASQTLSYQKTIERQVDYKKTRTGALLGTYDFMSPEQKRGEEATKLSDIYSLGVLIYNTLTGRLPRGAFKYPSEINSKLSKRWDNLIRKCLQENPYDRYKNISEIRTDILQVHIELKKSISIIFKNKKIQKSILIVLTIICIFLSFQLFASYFKNLFKKTKVISETPKSEKTPQSTKKHLFDMLSGTFPEKKLMNVLPEPKVFETSEDYNTSNVTSNSLIWIPPGKFGMGSENGESDETPVHIVELDGFYIGKYEVTQTEWELIMGNNPSNFKGTNLPVENVSWNDAMEFCKRLSQKSGEKYSLPTEVQWEYACRAGSNTIYNIGSSLTGCAWYNDGGGLWMHPRPVGEKSPNKWGLYDMHGNVWEWCLDYYDSKYYVKGPEKNPVNLDTSKYKVLRGGSWNDLPEYCTSSNRYGDNPDAKSIFYGFRVVRNLN